ncbi:hypothetical protein BJV82DRAFT_717503 [Fennellomyces sp. T-0311]|nr:hypothetical protein BJV82DRAFT_717503 [Fennellomyces sp. T-0311]
MSTANVLDPAMLNRLDPSSNMVFVAAVTVGESQSYYFRQTLSTTPSSSKYNQPKQIIPSVPRQRIKAPPNSFLSPIRSEKTPPRRSINNNHAALPPPPSTPLVQPPQPKQKPRRPYPLMHAISSPASLLSLKMNRRRRKVSFDENVVVVRTIIHTDDDDDEEEDLEHEEVTGWRRHSTGSAPPPSDDIENNEVAKQQILSVSNSLKRFVI